MLSAERDAGDLCRLDPRTIADAIERIDVLTTEMRLSLDLSGMDEHDSIVDHLGTIVSLRSRKICGYVGRGRPANMTRPETVYYDSLEAATLLLRDAWGLKE